MKRPRRGIKFRLGVAGFLFFLFFLAVGSRAFHLQIFQGDELRRLGERQHLKEWIVLPKRGTILDRSGQPLALSLEAQSVYARPRRLKDTEAAANQVAPIIGFAPEEIRKKLQTDKPFVWLKRQITPKEAEGIEAINIEGLGMSIEPKRYYPQGQLAGQVIGFVGRDSQALEGIELFHDRYIRGESGSPVIERDALGRRVLAKGVDEVRLPPGADIHLTLDSSIQHLAEKHLEEAVTKFRAKAGVAVVVEPYTGEILAISNYPFFDPNNAAKNASEEKRNRAITDSFEPGSTFKTIVAAAALEERVAGREDLFYCEFGKYAYGGRVIHDTHKYGWLPFYKIIQYSSNIGATKIAEKLKKERFFKYIEKFGFGRLTGIDMPGEVAGLVRPADRWSQIDLATHAFGQGIATTPIQLVMAYAAIANGGYLMRPFVVQRVVGPEGEVLVSNRPHAVRRVISEETARSLTSMLRGVVSEGGTGLTASVEGFDVAGKTGTAQKADLARGGYSRKRVASFIGFVPAEDPRMVLLVLIDEPEGSVYGGVVAAPAFRNIVRGALRYLGVVPAQPEFLPVMKSPDRILVQAGRRNGDATGNPEKTLEVPDFTGLSLREALVRASTMKLKIELRGKGYVIKQSPPPGGRWGSSDILTLNLQG